MTQEEYYNLLSSKTETTFGKRIRMWRALCNLTQEEFAKQLLLSSRTCVWKIEKAINGEEIEYDLLFRLFFYFSTLSDALEGYYKYLVNEILFSIRDAIHKKVESQGFQITKKHE